MAPSLLPRTLKLLRDRGYTAVVVERWNHHARVRQDLWGFDILAMHPEVQGLVGLQVTSVDHRSARLKKLAALSTTDLWCQTGNTAGVLTWRKPGPTWKRWTWAVAWLGPPGRQPLEG